MLITNLKASKKNNNYIQLFSGEKYIGSVFIDFVLENSIGVNEEINDSLLQELIERTAIKRLFDLSVNYILRRPRSRKEIYEYINKKLFKFKIKLSKAGIDEIMEKLERYNYINDEVFAEQWANSSLRKGRGPGRIRQELMIKGIDKNTIDNIVFKLDEEEIERQKEKVLEKYLRNKKFKNEYEEKFKTKQYLMSKGFYLDN